MTSHNTKKSPVFHSWYYFRIGYAEYFAFIIGLINTYTLTFYLLIENNQILGSIFPSFSLYVLVVSIIGIPLLLLLGYIHIQRSSAYRSSVEIKVESHPYFYKLPPGVHQEILAPFFYEMLCILEKINTGEKLTKNETVKIEKLDQNLKKLIDGGTLEKPKTFGNL